MALIKLILTWSAIVYTNVANPGGTFSITETKLYVPVVNLATQDNAKLLQQSKSGLERIINCNIYLSKPELLAQKQNLNNLVEPSFQEINRLFDLAFENDTQRTSNKRYYLPNVKIKHYNVTIDGQNIFGLSIKNNKIAN